MKFKRRENGSYEVLAWEDLDNTWRLVGTIYPDKFWFYSPAYELDSDKYQPYYEALTIQDIKEILEKMEELLSNP